MHTNPRRCQYGASIADCGGPLCHCPPTAIAADNLVAPIIVLGGLQNL